MPVESCLQDSRHGAGGAPDSGGTALRAVPEYDPAGSTAGDVSQ